MKKFLSIILSIILVFSISVNAYCAVPESYQKTKEYLWQIINDLGFISLMPFEGVSYMLTEMMRALGKEDEIENVDTEEEALDYVFDGISVNGDGNIVINGDSRQFIDYWINDIIEKSGFRYVYTFNISNYATHFGSGEQYRKVRDFISEQTVSGNTVAVRNGFNLFMVADLNNAGFVNQGEGTQKILAKPYDYSSWLSVTGYEYGYNTVNGVYKTGASGNNMNAAVRKDQYDIVSLDNWNWVSVGRNKVFKLYNTLNDLKADSVGQAPYYINNTVYNDYSNSSGDYIVTTDNSNNVSYGDIISYVDSFNTENGYYPTPDQINIYIEYVQEDDPNPRPTPLPDGGVNGGSGSSSAVANNEGININIENNHNINLGGGTVSGNGASGSGGIFDWISNIGSVIGDFIKNVGQLLADAISGITEAIQAILETIPNILSSLVEFVYGGLPEELKALVTLGIIAVVFVSVIKILRR